jgi:hypothetical protein
MKIKVSILNEFNTELSDYITDLDSYELSKKHNISIENSIDEMIYKIHFEQNFNKKKAEICNKSDSKKSETEIKIEEYCECKSICNEYENKTCKGVEKRKTNKIKKMKNYKVETEKQQQENIYERERFRAVDFTKWFSDFNGLTFEEKRVSKEHLNILYEQYLKRLGGGL